MDGDEVRQSFGFFGIYVESYKLIFKFRRIFTQIAVTLILPLSFIFLLHQPASDILDRWIDISTKQGLRDAWSWYWAIYTLFKVVYFSFLLIFSLLSTSAVVYMVACIYCEHDVVNLGRLLTSVVPRVWKRLIVTFSCTFFICFLYNVLFIVILFAIFLWYTIYTGDNEVGQAYAYVLMALYLFGFAYMSMVWQLASVVTVLEDSYGLKAMIRSKNLIKGKVMVSMALFLKSGLTLVVVNNIFTRFTTTGVMVRIWVGLACLVLLTKAILLILVLHTVVYFACKAHHGEVVDKGGLKDHLQVYLGEYAPLDDNGVQLERFHV